jgi:two-component sensor histidine kinase
MNMKYDGPSDVGKLLRRERSLAEFGTFAFRETDLQVILEEAARVCAESLNVPFSKICRFRTSEDDLLVVAGHGWKPGVVGFAISVANESSPQGRAFSTGKPQLCPNIDEANTFDLPAFYADHNILSTVDVIVAAKSGAPFGVLEVDSPDSDAFREHDIDFLTGFANILAEAVVTAARAADLRQTIIRMQELVEEKDILAQELKHRVRNSLHLVYGLLSAELDGVHSEASIAAFRSIALRVMGLAEVFDHLLGIGMNKVINLGEYITGLCETLPELYSGTNVTLTSAVEPILLDLDDATTVGIVLTELINNAYLHAFPDGVGEISVVLRSDLGGALLSISDNGIGFEEIETKRRGMALVRRLLDQLGATLSLHSDHGGSSWSITLPIPAVVLRTAA